MNTSWKRQRTESDMDTSEDEPIEPRKSFFVDYDEVAKQYRQTNWGAPHNPFHSCFLAADKKENKQAYTNAFRSGPYASLHIDVPPVTTQNIETQAKPVDKLIVPKSALKGMSQEERNKILWDNF